MIKMKILFVTFLLASTLFSLIVTIDLFMGTKINYLFIKETNPFQVMEPAEYALIFILATSVLVTAVISFLKKRKKKSQGNSN
jgi:uncharacterized membrane protein YwaF